MGVGRAEEHTAREYEQKVGQLDNGEFPHVAQVNDMRHNAQHRKEEREAIDQPQETLKPNNEVDHPRKKFLCQDCVFFDKFGEVIESGSFWAFVSNALFNRFWGKYLWRG